MISVIICSRSADKGLLTHIENTIGVPHEVIRIDNSNNAHSIFSAYNLGVEKSKYPILCFMHDDITYHTNNWGAAVADHFEHEKLEAICIAGTPYLSFMPGAWWGSGVLYENIIQSTSKDDVAVLKSNSDGIKARQVAAFDGVWFCIKKSLFNQIRFDAERYIGFHFYDVDICMQMYRQQIKMHCINNVLIHHPSIGNIEKSWIANALIFHKKWAKQLPASCIKMPFEQRYRYEYKTLNGFISICKLNNWPEKKTYQLALKYILQFKKGYLFYKTPGYIIKFLYKMLAKNGAVEV